LQRWNRTLNYWDNGILSKNDLPAGATEEEKDFIEYVPYQQLYDKILVRKKYIFLSFYLDLDCSFFIRMIIMPPLKKDLLV
jgi:hypothetical protein